jgi:phenylacetate-coenzyme A ligase PaaK-like adenylate-forming protein
MLATQLKQIQDVAAALWRAGRLQRHDRWSRAALKRHQQEMLERMVRHAVARSPFYRALYDDLSGEPQIALTRLPVIDKAMVMENFDDLVTDRRLKLAELEAHIDRGAPGGPFLGDYRVLSTTGTSGRRGVFVYDRAAWRTVLANTIRWHRFAGLRPRLPRRLRICAIGADAPAHISRSLPESGDVGLFRVLALSATQPMAALTAALQRFQPQVLMPYPSLAVLLAQEQLAGRLAIAPEMVLTHSEMLSAAMRRRIAEAWNAAVFDHYGLTEEPHVACECTAHDGLHVFEDLSIIEVLDDAGRPVPSGALGARYLLTNLYNRVQPLIRYEVTDAVALSEAPCACGRPFARITEIAGRSEQTFHLRGAAGGRVAVPPIAFTSRLDIVSELVEYELRHDERKIELLAVPRAGVEREALRRRLIETLREVVGGLGAEPPDIAVVFRAALERRPERMGKRQPVRGARPPGAG